MSSVTPIRLEMFDTDKPDSEVQSKLKMTWVSVDNFEVQRRFYKTWI